MKLLKYIFNIIVWTTLGLYLLFILTFKIPAVQQYFGSRLSALLARQLGTSVSIGSIDIGIPNSVRLYQVVIRDQKGHDMLTARRLSARIDLIPLLQGKVSIASAQVFGANATLYQRDSLSRPNFQFVIDSLASKDTTSTTPLDLRINSFILRNSRVSFHRYDLPETPKLLNPNHLNLSDISAHIILKTLTNDSVNVNVKRLSFKEQSGLQIDRLALRYTGGMRHSLLEDFTLEMPHTSIQLDDIEAHYLVRQGHVVIPSLYYRGGIQKADITLSDLACFLPSLNTFNSTLHLSSTIEGQGDKLSIPDLTVSSTTGDIDLQLDGWIQQLGNSDPEWQANINNITLSAKTVNFISENLKGQRAEIPDVVTRLGNIHMMGIAKGQGIGTLLLNSKLTTDIGQTNLEFRMDKQHTFHSHVDTKSIHLGRLLADERFGHLGTTITIEGRLPKEGGAVLNAQGLIHHFDYNGYQYQHIDINGSYSAESIIGQLSIDDPNISLHIAGSVDRDTHSNTVNVKTEIAHFSPKATQLSEQWGDALFDLQVVANFKARTLNDAVGTLDIHGLTMTAPQEHYRLDTLHVETGYENDSHYVRMRSDFGRVDITGNFEYETLTRSFTNILAANLPTLPGLPPLHPGTNNNFSITARIEKSDWLQHLLHVPADLRQPLTLQGTINDRLHTMALECDVPQFYYGESGFKNGHVSIASPQDTLRYDLRVARLYNEASPVDLHLYGKAADNHLHTSLVWDNNNPTETMRGQLNAIANFDTSHNQQQTAYIRLLPSVINIHNSNWTIAPAHITYSKNYLNIRDLAVRHEQQHLIINGTASESTSDSLFADLIDIDVSYILQLVDFDAVDFNGYASGTGVLRGVFGNLQADARLRVSDFEFQHGRMGTLLADVNWNDREQQIDIHATADDGDEAKTYIDGYVSPQRNYIDLGIRAAGTYLDFARSFTESFINRIDGHASGTARIIGPLDAINLTGELVLNGKAHVTPLGCTYEMRNDTLRMVPNEIAFVHCPIYDSHGNEGMLTGGIHHQELTNLTYDIHVDTRKLTAYDFTDFGDSNFYGTVLVDGRASIHGDDDGVSIEADVTPLDNTIFVYNASSPDVITDQEFIQWGKADSTAQGQHSSTDNRQEEQQQAAPLFRSDLTMRIKMNINPNATLRLLMDEHTGDYITLHGSGDLQASYYNKGGFNMFGQFQVSSGTYNVTIQDIIRKEFTFSEGGTISFGGDPYDAQLNMQAQHMVSGVSLSDLNIGQSFSNTVRVNCLMNISGQPSAPVIDFDLDIPSVNSDERQMLRTIINGQEEMRQQVIYLLAVGRFYPQGANNASESDAQRSSTSLAMQSLLSGTLSGQINAMLSQVIKSNNWNFGANISTGDEGWNNAEYEGIVNGRLLNNRLIINGQFGYRDRTTTASPSFIGDFDIRYLLFPNGNLALKVYNQTNDRYFTRSSLNTQGIGIIMKKDFSGWRDLFNLNRKKKVAPKPQQ